MGWFTSLAQNFSISNGVCQGGVSSGVFFVVYIDQLLKLIRESGIGSTIYGVFYGVIIYADDIFLPVIQVYKS